MLDEKEAKDLLNFLKLDMRPDLKGQATEYILGLTGNKDGCKYLGTKPALLKAVLALTRDPSVAVVKDCYHTLINLSADPVAHQALIKEANVLPPLLHNLLDPGYIFADQICTILTNLSRNKETCREVLRAIQDEGVGLAQIVEVFCTEGYNEKASLHYLGPLLSNLTQLPEARSFILDKDRCVIQRLLPFTQYESSAVKRGGVVGTLRNCCFDYSCHEWLLSDAVDILPFLLLPLAGPEELSEEENEGLPVDLQYLPESPNTQEGPDIRNMLLETMLLLTSTKAGRQILKKKNVYPIMREFHKWEKEPDVMVSCEKLVQVLIGDEPETGMENLMEVNIPEDVEKKFQALDVEEQKQIEKEREELLKSEAEEKAEAGSSEAKRECSGEALAR
ncbi:protein HGH1 homolog [Polyodon spathula]|uniref:protein HGH1 homolog n=1 Tax=Polyodon spathula TaxID=7913 RepID=UPI001B7F0F8A|nr:protein HGH1 homolog [Polyodon spathula]